MPNPERKRKKDQLTFPEEPAVREQFFFSLEVSNENPEQEVSIRNILWTVHRVQINMTAKNKVLYWRKQPDGEMAQQYFKFDGRDLTKKITAIKGQKSFPIIDRTLALETYPDCIKPGETLILRFSEAKDTTCLYFTITRIDNRRYECKLLSDMKISSREDFMPPQVILDSMPQAYRVMFLFQMAIEQSTPPGIFAAPEFKDVSDDFLHLLQIDKLRTNREAPQEPEADPSLYTALFHQFVEFVLGPQADELKIITKELKEAQAGAEKSPDRLQLLTKLKEAIEKRISELKTFFDSLFEKRSRYSGDPGPDEAHSYQNIRLAWLLSSSTPRLFDNRLLTTVNDSSLPMIGFKKSGQAIGYLKKEYPAEFQALLGLRKFYLEKVKEVQEEVDELEDLQDSPTFLNTLSAWSRGFMELFK